MHAKYKVFRQDLLYYSQLSSYLQYFVILLYFFELQNYREICVTNKISLHMSRAYLK